MRRSIAVAAAPRAQAVKSTRLDDRPHRARVGGPVGAQCLPHRLRCHVRQPDADRDSDPHRRVGILTCLWAWNDFLLPLVVLSDPDTRTLPLVQYVFQSQFSTDYTTAFASYLMAMAPMLLVYAFAQRWVISGVMRGSVK
jgi:hypothetical protein